MIFSCLLGSCSASCGLMPWLAVTMGRVSIRQQEAKLPGLHGRDDRVPFFGGTTVSLTCGLSIWSKHMYPSSQCSNGDAIQCQYYLGDLP